MDDIKTLLQAMAESQEKMLAKMDQLEARFDEVVSRLEEYGIRQVKIEKDFAEFKSNIVEQVSKQLLRGKNIYH